MSTSGVLTEIQTQDVYCGATSMSPTWDQCMFEGETEVWYDSETQEVWWVCPECGYEHESSYGDLSADIEADWYQG